MTSGLKTMPTIPKQAISTYLYEAASALKPSAYRALASKLRPAGLNGKLFFSPLL
jgi:hypothetical protein